MAEYAKKSAALIGMPGSGKTVIGKLAAEKLGLCFADMDDYIEALSGKSIPQLFAAGEECFRNWETRACEELSREEGLIVACGGGVVKRAANIGFLKRNCVILFIDRPLEHILSDIRISTRPLLKDGADRLRALYDERIGLYRAFADREVRNAGTVGDAVSRVAEALGEKRRLSE